MIFLIIDQSDYRHTFKLLLIKNDYQYDVLKDINKDLKKETYQINDSHYLLRLPEKQIRFDKKIRQKYQDLRIELRLIKQQNSWHLKSLLENLKKILIPTIQNNQQQQNEEKLQRNYSSDKKMSIENSPLNKKTQQFQQPPFYQTQNFTIYNSVLKDSNNTINNNNYSNSDQYHQPQKMYTEKGKEQEKESNIANSQQQEENSNQNPEKKNIVPIINKFTQEYLKTRDLSEMDYCTWIFEVVSIFQTDFEREEAQKIISRSTQFYKDLLNTKKEQQLLISSETILLLNKPTNNNNNSILTQFNSSFSQLSSARKSKATSITATTTTTSVKKQKLINQNKFASDEVSNQLASTNQAKKKLAKNSQQEQQLKDKKKQFQQNTSKKYQLQITKSSKQQQQQLQEQFFDSQGMTRSQLKLHNEQIQAQGLQKLNQQRE